MDDAEKNFFETLANPDQEPEFGAEPMKIELARASATAGILKAPLKKAAKIKEGLEPEGQLTIDVYQASDEIIIESAIAGVQPEDLDISVTSDSVSIKGERHREHETKDSNYLYQECYWGRFSRSIILPQEIDADNAWVNLKNGILTIHLPKLNKKQEKRLKIRAD